MFLLSLFITLSTIVVVIIMYLKHKLVWEPSYNRYEDEEEDVKFKSIEWVNQPCDEHFSHFKMLTLDELRERNVELYDLVDQPDKVEISSKK